jgi:hypothetical protein
MLAQGIVHTLRRNSRSTGDGRRAHRMAIGTLALLVAVVGLALSAPGALASSPPSVVSEKASEIGRGGAVLNAVVNPNGSEVTECDFEYGTSESSLTGVVPCSYSPGAGVTPVPVLASLEGLSETTTYYARIRAKSVAGESTGSVVPFETLPTAPRTNPEPPKVIGHTTATLRAYVTPNDLEVTECYFAWGSAPTELNKTAPCSPAPGAGSEPVLVSASLSGLAESTTYYYKVFARNSLGLESTGKVTFETLPSAPTAHTEPPRSVTPTSAVIRAYVDPNDSAVSECRFEWGSASVEEHSVGCTPAEIGSGEELVAVSAELTGLTGGNTYQYRVVVTNGHGTQVSHSERFTTTPHAPRAAIDRVQELTDESALLRGVVYPEGLAISECSFEYGPTPALGESVACSTLAEAGEHEKVTASVGGLAPSSGYYARIRAANTSGVFYTKDEQFTTAEGGLLPVVQKIKPSKGGSEGGTVVTITGQFLNGATAVVFGETEASAILSDSGGTIKVIAPPGVGTVDVFVQTAAGESKAVSRDRFTYGAPTITGVAPSSGPTAGGTEVTITGTGFEPGTSGTTFKFGKVAATLVECSSSTSCLVIAPPAAKGRAGTVDIQARVAKASLKTPADHYVYD